MALISAFEALEFEFDHGETTRGYSTDAIIEIGLEKSAPVCLLLSTGGRQTSPRCAVCLATIGSVLQIDFTQWLANRMHRLGFTRPWKTSQDFGTATVQAEYFCADAMLLTIYDNAMSPP